MVKGAPVVRPGGFLGYRRSQNPALSNDDRNPYGNGLWKVEFGPADLAFGSGDYEVYHIFLQGPSSSQFQMFINQTPYSASSRGDINEWDPNQPMRIIGGQSLIFYWNSAGTPNPLVVIACRLPRF